MLEVTTLSARLSALCWSSCIVEDCERIAYSIVLGYHCVLQSFCRARFEAHDSEPVTSTSLQFNSCFKTFWNTDLSEARTCQDMPGQTGINTSNVRKGQFYRNPNADVFMLYKMDSDLLAKVLPASMSLSEGRQKRSSGLSSGVTNRSQANSEKGRKRAGWHRPS